MNKLLTLSLLSLSIYSVSDGHPEGAFNTAAASHNTRCITLQYWGSVIFAL